MEHGGEAARPATVGSTELGMAAAVQGGEVVHMTIGTFHGQLGAAAGTARRASFEATAAAYLNSAEFARQVRTAASGTVVSDAMFHRELGPGVEYASIGLVGVVLVGPQLPGGVVPVHDNYYGYSALQPRPGAGLGVVLVPRSGAGQGEGPVDMLPVPDGVGEVFDSLLPGGVDAAYDNYGYYALQPRSGAEHGEVLVDLLLDGAEQGEVFVDRVLGGGRAVHDYGYYPLQHLPGAGRGELVGVVFNNSGNFAQQTLPSTGYDGSRALADDLDAVYEAPGRAAEHLRRLLAFAGIGACSVAVNGLAAGPGSPAVAFHFFVLLLGGLFMVILHVLHV